MSKNYTLGDDVLVQKKSAVRRMEEKELAEQLLHSEGYVPSTKPRRVNGGQDLEGARHTDKNKERLNSTLSRTPAQAHKAHSSKKNFPSVRRTISAPVPTEREKAASPFPISYIFFILILTAIMVYVVHLYIEIADLDATLSEYNNALVELKGEQNDLEFEKNKLYNLEEIERIAREEYGMVSADLLPKEYITSDDDDKIQIIDTGEEESAAGVLMSGFGRTVTNLLSYIN
jgi:cell division protein FtsB